MDDTLTYRFARADEVDAVARMVRHSFPGLARTPDFWNGQLTDPRYGGGASGLFIGAQGRDIVAAVQLHRLREFIAGEVFPVAGVGTVAISAAHRKRGLGSGLMTAALRAARERGDLGSALYPFRVSYYARLGYGQAGEALQYQVPPSSLPDSPERLRVELLDGAATSAEALQLYNEWARTQTGLLERTARMWDHVCDATERGLAGYRSVDGALEGYAVVAYRTDLSRRDRYLEVQEVVWTTDRARRGLYGWLHSLGDQWDQLLLRALPSQRLGDWIREPRLPHDAAPQWELWSPGATLMMGPMFRLLDVPAAWERRAVAGDATLTVAFDVADEQIPENSGRWFVSCDGGRVTCSRDGHADVTLTLDIATLSRLFIGALSPSVALSAALLACDRPHLLPQLDAALALPEPWTFDRF